MPPLNSSIGRPPTISRQYRSSATSYYPAASRGSLHLQWGLPEHTECAKNGRKSCICVGGVYRRRYTPPPDTYHYRLTVKDLPERCLAGVVAIGRQIKAYEGPRWPSLASEATALSLVFVFERPLPLICIKLSS